MRGIFVTSYLISAVQSKYARFVCHMMHMIMPSYKRSSTDPPIIPKQLLIYARGVMCCMDNGCARARPIDPCQTERCKEERERERERGGEEGKWRPQPYSLLRGSSRKGIETPLGKMKALSILQSISDDGGHDPTADCTDGREQWMRKSGQGAR